MTFLTFCLALLVCFSSLGTKASAGILPVALRQLAKDLSCEESPGTDCRLAHQFSPDDPRGNAYLKNRVALVIFANESDSQSKTNHQRMSHVMEPWLEPLKRRNVIMLSVVCKNTGKKSLCSKYDQMSFYTFHSSAANVEPFHLDDFYDEPTDLLFTALRLSNGLPETSQDDDLIDINFWKHKVQSYDLPRKKLRYLILHLEHTNQATFRSIEVGGLLRQFGVVMVGSRTASVSDVDPKMIAGKKSDFQIFDLRKESGCDLDNIPATCNHLRTIKGKDLFKLTAEELACNVLLTGPEFSSRKLHLRDHGSDIIDSILKVCPNVLLLNEDLIKNLPNSDLDAALEKYQRRFLVAILFDSKTEATMYEAIEKMKQSGISATILIRKDRWTAAHSHVIESSSAERLQHSLADKMAIYEYLRSTLPEMTYLRFSGSSTTDQAFTLDNDQLFSEVAKAKSDVPIQGRSLTIKTFKEAVDKDFLIVHFYQSWNTRCQAATRVISAAAEVMRKRFKSSGLFAHVNCFSEDQVCSEQGVRAYPTVRIYRRGSWESFDDLITMDTLIRHALLSMKKFREPITTSDRWSEVVTSFASVPEPFFVAVSLHEPMQKVFKGVATDLEKTELLIESSRSALPLEIQQVLPKDSGCIFAFNPRLGIVEGLLSTAKTNKEFLDFISSTKLFTFTELTMEGLLEVQKANQPLLIAFARQMDSTLQASLIATAEAHRGRVFVRWMNASTISTLSVMQAYQINHTPSLILKTQEKIFSFAEDRLQTDRIAAWIKDVFDSKVSSHYVLQPTPPKPIRQYFDHLGQIYKEEEKGEQMQDGVMTAANGAQMKDEL